MPPPYYQSPGNIGVSVNPYTVAGTSVLPGQVEKEGLRKRKESHFQEGLTKKIRKTEFQELMEQMQRDIDKSDDKGFWEKAFGDNIISDALGSDTLKMFLPPGVSAGLEFVESYGGLEKQRRNLKGVKSKYNPMLDRYKGSFLGQEAKGAREGLVDLTKGDWKDDFTASLAPAVTSFMGSKVLGGGEGGGLFKDKPLQKFMEKKPLQSLFDPASSGDGIFKQLFGKEGLGSDLGKNLWDMINPKEMYGRYQGMEGGDDGDEGGFFKKLMELVGK